ncbi:hypothetical protein HKX48_007095 [Thoreauomyces humboldtii]|nr:hypothetical protein HKX48_007095 [Thoreauomyces humboldtii]
MAAVHTSFPSSLFRLSDEHTFDAIDAVEAVVQDNSGWEVDTGPELPVAGELKFILYRLFPPANIHLTIIRDPSAPSERDQFGAFLQKLPVSEQSATKRERQTLRTLLSDHKVRPQHDAIFIEISKELVLFGRISERGTILRGQDECPSPAAFLRLALDRPVGGTDYNRLMVTFTINTGVGVKCWPDFKNDDETTALFHEMSIKDSPDLDPFIAGVSTILTCAGVVSVNSLIEDPFVTKDNRHTMEETAKELLLSRFPNDNQATFPSILEGLGLTTASVLKLKEAAGGLVQYYGHRVAAEIAVEYAVGAYATLPIASDFPPDASILDKTFPGPTGVTQYNMTKSSQTITAAIAAASGAALSAESKLWFHATSWEYVSEMCNPHIGIRHAKGHINQDFGRDAGFYTGDSLAVALNWSYVKRKIFRGQNAIMVFRDVKKAAILNGLKWKTLSDATEWREVVFDARQGRPSIADDYAFIRGPMLLNTNASNRAECLPSRQNQTAAKTPAATRAVQTTLVCVIYISQTIAGQRLLEDYKTTGPRS